MQILREAWSYPRTPPNLFQFSAKDKQWQRWALSIFAEERVDCPPEGLVRLGECFALEGRFLVECGRALPESLLDHPSPDGLAKRLATRLEARDHVECAAAGRVDVLFAKAGSDNYGHMLADVAPKLINLARAELGPVRLHVPEDGRIYLPFLRDLVERLAIDAEFRIAAPEELLRFEQAAFLTPVALHSRRKSAALRELRELLLAAYGTGGSRRLFVTRKPREKRTIANVVSVESIFAGCGFEIVHPRRLTIAEQVRLFSQASHIAGPVGAGMANMLFAPNSAEILLIDPGLCDFFFWDAANLIGQPFHWHFASTPGRFDRSLVQRAFHVDGQALLATLRSLGWTDGRSPVLGWRHRLSSSLWRRSQP